MALPRRFVMRDNDTKLTSQFDAVIELSGAKIKQNTPASPNLRAHVERFIQSLKQECLDKFVIVAKRHLNPVCRVWSHHYNDERPHSARSHLRRAWETSPESLPVIRPGKVMRESRLGGLINSYSQRAA